jgi:predicted glycosyltransferase
VRILVDVSHPAHVHFFRHAIEEWTVRGHNISIVARDKDLVLELLEEYGLEYTTASQAREGTVGLMLELVQHEAKVLSIARRFRPHIMLNIGGTFVVHAGKLLGVPTIAFSDTEHAKLSNLISYPFATAICTPACYKVDLGLKQVRYNGYQELAYLHPNRFQPQVERLAEAGIGPNERYFVIRFVSWKAAHDVGQGGFSLAGKHELVRRLSEVGRVIITSESPLPPEFERFRMSLPPTRVHDLLYYSTVYIGEGGTMASEAAILGTPSIYVNSLTMGYIEELEEYGMLHRVIDERQAGQLALELAQDVDAKNKHQHRRKRLLQDKVDVTGWLADYVESFTS